MHGKQLLKIIASNNIGEMLLSFWSIQKRIHIFRGDKTQTKLLKILKKEKFAGK